jgi:branched-chain amino acid transport system permease protein
VAIRTHPYIDNAPPERNEMAVKTGEAPLQERLRALARRPDSLAALLIGLLFLAAALFPKGLPAGIAVNALVFAARSSLAVAGVVLVYRSSRIINVAQVQIGSFGAFIFFELVKNHTLLRGLDKACNCLPATLADSPGWAVHAEYWLSVLAAVLLSALIGLVMYALVIRRFRDAPPLVGTVATIAVAQALVWLASQVPGWFNDEDKGGTVPIPVKFSFRVAPALFGAADVAALVVGVLGLVGIVWFLRRTRMGVAVRASAENPDRASSLGMNVSVVGGVVWTLAGALSGLAGVLLTMTTGGGAGGGGTGTLVRVLAAAVIGGMVNLPLALLAGLGLAFLDHSFLWSFGNATILDLVVFGVLLAFLLLRPVPRAGRVDPSGGSWQAAREVRPIPAELRGVADVARLRRRAAIGVGIVVLGFPLIMSPSQTASSSVMLLYGIVGLSLLLLTGWAGLISLGQFAFAAIGAFGVALFGGQLGLPFLLALPLAGLLGALSSVVVGLPALRIRGLYLAVTTLAFAVAVTNVLLSERYGGRLIPSTLDRPSVFGLDASNETVFYYLALAVLGLCVLAVVGMRRSRTARALIACRDNDRAAQSFGINLVRARLETFAVSGLLAALAGGLFAYQQGGVASGNFSPDLSLTLFLMVVIGGLGSIAGPLLGAFLVGGLTIFLPTYVGVFSALLVLVILGFVPGGLTEAVYALRDALLRRIAVRHRIRVPSLLADGRAFSGDERAPLTPRARPLPVRYQLPRKPLTVPKVAATAKGRQ